MVEFVIWGIAPGQETESLLLTQIDGEKIVSEAKACQLAFLSIKYNCTEVRVQKIDLSQNNINEQFKNTIQI